MEQVQTSHIKLVECPRDAMQGWQHFIPTRKKAEYINLLLQVGFDTIDFGSFVSPKAIPQMADTPQVLEQLSLDGKATKLLAIVANIRGAQEAVSHEKITSLGFPFSISPTFQQRNTNSSIEESLTRVRGIQELCLKNRKELVVYISMAFGNPYGDAYGEELVMEWTDRMISLEIKTISLADTIGVAEPSQITSLLSNLIPQHPGTEIGVHLHSTPFNRQQKIDAALFAGCKRFDGALKGIGGCPMADDELVGNINMEEMIEHFDALGISSSLDKKALDKALLLANEIFL